MTREGFIFPLPFFVLAAVSFLLFKHFFIMKFAYLSGVFFLAALLLILFFRDPDRKIPDGEKLVLSPADGRIIREENESGSPSLSIFLSIFNVHVTRSPVTGYIKSAKFRKGKFRVAYKDKAKSENQRNEIDIETESGLVRFNQVAGAIARRTIFRPKAGQMVRAGDRVGIIRFGSRVDLFLPSGSTLEIKEGQRVVGGKTILGRLP